MALEISPSVAEQLPAVVTNALKGMTTEDQMVFEEIYKSKRRNPFLLLILAIFLPIQHFLEGKIFMGILFWCTLGGIFIWYIIGIFTVYGRNKSYNEDLATSTLRDMKIMSA